MPVDSAKKLRWYDKAEVASLTRQHVREKHLLLDTIAALKKVITDIHVFSVPAERELPG